MIVVQGSWERKLIDRVNNLEKSRNLKRKRVSSGDDESPRAKRGRPKKTALSQYPQPMKTEMQIHVSLWKHLQQK